MIYCLIPNSTIFKRRLRRRSMKQQRRSRSRKLMLLPKNHQHWKTRLLLYPHKQRRTSIFINQNEVCRIEKNFLLFLYPHQHLSACWKLHLSLSKIDLWWLQHTSTFLVGLNWIEPSQIELHWIKMKFDTYAFCLLIMKTPRDH